MGKRSFLKFLLELYKPVKFATIIMVAARIATEFILLYKDRVFKDVIDLMTSETFVSGELESYVIYICAIMLVSIIAKNISNYYRMVVLLKKQPPYIINKVFNDMRVRSHEFFVDNYSGKISASINQVTELTTGLTEKFIKMFTMNMSKILAINIFMFGVSKKVFYITAAYSLVMIIIRLAYFMKFWLLKAKTAEILSREHSGILNDAIANIVPLKIYNAIKNYAVKIRDSKLSATSESSAANKVEIIYSTFIASIFDFIFVIFVMKYAIDLYLVKELSVGSLVFIFSTVTALRKVIGDFCWGYIVVAETLVKLKSSYELLYNPNNIIEDTDENLKVSDGIIEFKNISFAYDDKKVLDNFNIKINKGESVGIIGESGSGKTTINNLLFRFYEANEGELLIDGQNILEFSRESLYNNATYVPQETILLHTTIYENMKIAKPSASKEEIIAAAKKAQIHEYIERLPEGYNTIVGERGVKLSGGQRQRIALTRIFLRDAKIIVFDEATSALDNTTEYRVQESINEFFTDKTIICIAHRLSTLKEMDRIIVLGENGIIEEGKPEDIINKYSIVRETKELLV